MPPFLSVLLLVSYMCSTLNNMSYVNYPVSCFAIIIIIFIKVGKEVGDIWAFTV